MTGAEECHAARMVEVLQNAKLSRLSDQQDSFADRGLI